MEVSQRSETVYLNGSFLPRGKACISPDDRGFHFADGVYEVIRFYKGKAFCFDEHIERLERSLEAIRMRKFDVKGLEAVCVELIRTNNLADAYAVVYIQITRGSHIRMHGFPDPATQPTVYATAHDMPPRRQEMKNGIRVITHDDIRWARCDIKSIALLPNVLMYQEAREKDASECFFIRHGVYTEATHSNIMAIRNGTLYTHPDSPYILPGITKKVVFRLCRELHIPVCEEAIRTSSMQAYDEFLITGTGNEIMPVIIIDEYKVKDGKPGTYTRMLQHAFFRITYEALAGANNVI